MAGVALAEVGRFAEGLTTAEGVIREGQAAAHPYSLYHAYWARAVVHLGRGEPERAGEAASRIRQLAAGTIGPFVYNAAGLLGHAHALAGRSTEALRLLEGVDLARERRNDFTAHRYALSLREACLLGERLDDALRTARGALTLAQTSNARGREAHVRRLLGDVHAARGDDDQAEQFYRDAMALGAELGMDPLLARCHLGLGGFHRRLGKPEQAREHLETATVMLRDMEMWYWMEKATTALRELG